MNIARHAVRNDSRRTPAFESLESRQMYSVSAPVAVAGDWNGDGRDVMGIVAAARPAGTQVQSSAYTLQNCLVSGVVARPTNGIIGVLIAL